MRRLCAVLVMLWLCRGLVPSSVSAGNSQYFPETGQTSSNAFYEFWQAHGALPILGIPVSPVYKSKDNGRIIQIYERAVMEWHPENSRENRVQLMRLGAIDLDYLDNPRTKEKTGARDAAAPARSCATNGDCETFSITRHTVLGAFRDYWYENGGLATFGYALTEELSLCGEGTGTACSPSFSAQFFERNVFEWHPEISGGKVLLRRLGASVWGNTDKSTINSGNITTVPDYDGGNASSSPSPIYNPASPSAPVYMPPPTPVYTSPPVPVYNPPPASSGSVSGSGYSCPSGYPIKGNLTTYNGDKIYHVPGGQFYDSTKPEQCFATEADARAAGYRASLR